MKKICFLTDSIFSFGGVQRVTAVIAKELAKDYDVTIVTLDKPSEKDTSYYGLEEADIIAFLTTLLRPNGKTTAARHTATSIAGCYRKHG